VPASPCSACARALPSPGGQTHHQRVWQAAGPPGGAAANTFPKKDTRQSVNSACNMYTTSLIHHVCHNAFDFELQRVMLHIPTWHTARPSHGLRCRPFPYCQQPPPTSPLSANCLSRSSQPASAPSSTTPSSNASSSTAPGQHMTVHTCRLNTGKKGSLAVLLHVVFAGHLSGTGAASVQSRWLNVSPDVPVLPMPDESCQSGATIMTAAKPPPLHPLASTWLEAGSQQSQ